MKVMFVEGLKDLKDVERTNKRIQATQRVELMFSGEQIEFVDQWEEGYGDSMILRLSRTLKTMEDCQLIVFLPGWNNCRYCRWVEEVASLNNAKMCRYFDL